MSDSYRIIQKAAGSEPVNHSPPVVLLLPTTQIISLSSGRT